MSGFDAEPMRLFATAAQVRAAEADGRTALAGLQAMADDLLSYGWTGAAAAGFGAGWDEWLAGARTMLTGLDELASAVEAAGRDYAAAEDASRAGFTRLAS